MPIVLRDKQLLATSRMEQMPVTSLYQKSQFVPPYSNDADVLVYLWVTPGSAI
jgi:hypothetical protein